MNRKEQTFFFKRLAYLTNAHVPLAEGLSVLQDQSKNKRQAQMLKRVAADIQEGQSLSKTFGKFPRVFNAFSISLLKVGESSGTLPAALEHLAEELKKKQQLRSKVIGALVYPAFVALATVGVVVFLLLFLFPKIVPLFKSVHADVPVSTHIVIAVSAFLAHYWHVIALGIFISGGIWWVLRSYSSTFRRLTDEANIRLPLMSGMLRSYAVSNISRTLGLLLQHGVAMEEALRITADATTNTAYQHTFTYVRLAVGRGARLSDGFAAFPVYYSAAFCHMIAVGERSGTLPETCLYLAELFESEVDEYAKNISTLIEPILMVCMGILVGFIAIAIISPLYGITQNLHV